MVYLVFLVLQALLEQRVRPVLKDLRDHRASTAQTVPMATMV